MKGRTARRLLACAGGAWCIGTAGMTGPAAGCEMVGNGPLFRDDAWKHLDGLSVHDDVPFVAFGNESRDPDWGVATLAGGAWQVLGADHAFDSWETPAFGECDGIPYVAYGDAASARLTVEKYENGAWVRLPASPIPMHDGSSCLLHVSGGIPYVYFDDFDPATRTITFGLVRYENGRWIRMGHPPQQRAVQDLCVEAGVPYIIYEDEPFWCPTYSVMKYENLVWQQVGSARMGIPEGESDPYAAWAAIRVENGVPFAAFFENTYIHQGMTLTVKRFDGNDWVQMGGRVTESAYWVSAMDFCVKDGTPYIAYADGEMQEGPAVPVLKAYVGDWVDVARPGFVGCINVGGLKLAESNHRLYVAFLDSNFENPGPTTLAMVRLDLNRPPVFNPLAPQEAREGATLTFVAEASDAENDPLSYWATDLPAGATFDCRTHTFRWTPSFTQGRAESYILTLRARDTWLHQVSMELPITVRNVNRAPIFLKTSPVAYSVKTGAVLSFSVRAIDSDGDAVRYSVTPLPPGARMDAGTGQFTWDTRGFPPGSGVLTFRAQDGAGGSASLRVTITITR